jgi:hypothetical protein
MTSEQYCPIYGAILTLKCEAAGLRAVAKYEWEKPHYERLFKEAEAALKALDEAYSKSAILRGQAPCPECGEYIDINGKKEEAA